MTAQYLRSQDLTPEQSQAVDDWWNKNDPDQITYDFVDNTRYAIKGNKEQEYAYDDIRCGGCCGFVDVELDLPDGTVLLFGFNYGH